MAKKQLLTLFFCNLIIWTLGNGLLPLLPIYAATLDASPTVIGYYLAASYLAMAVGTIAAGRLAEQFGGYKRLLVGAGLLCAPALGLMGQAATTGILVVLTMLVWFLVGVIVALLNIVAGLSVNPAERGKVFGVVFLSVPLGALAGGATLGALADWGGYGTMFFIMALGWLSLPIVAAFFLIEPDTPQRSQSTSLPLPSASLFANRSFALVVIATILASTTVFVGRLGTSLSMEKLQFTSTMVSSTAAVGGLVALPLIPLLGTLSDKLGRRGLLMLLYGSATLGVLTLDWATELWHFWLAASLLSISAYGNGTLSVALANDLLPRALLNKGLSLFSSTMWIAGIIGFAGTGVLLEYWGPTLVFAGGAALPIVAGLLLLSARPKHSEALAHAQPVRQSWS
ncbi:MAG: MFS transporter [Anaerolineae bacterium]|nr:MFS transporter [Anaerolineae bacterium]